MEIFGPHPWYHSAMVYEAVHDTPAISFVGSRVSHYGDVIMGAITSQITSLAIVCSTIYSDADHRKHQSSASLAFVRGIHRGPVNFPHKWPVTRKMFPFDDVIMSSRVFSAASHQRARHIRINTVTGLLGGKLLSIHITFDSDEFFLLLFCDRIKFSNWLVLPMWDDILTPMIFRPRGWNIITIYWHRLPYFDSPTPTPIPLIVVDNVLFAFYF